MASTSEALSKKLDRVKKSIEQFPAAASSLNIATSQLGQSIGQLDAILKKFSIGIPTWVSFNGSIDSVPSYYHEDLGYAKIAGRWGIAVRTVSGDVRSEEGDRVEQWLFPDAPRFLGVQAIEKIPDLLEALLNCAAEMAKKMTEKADEVDVLTAGINSAVNLTSGQRALGPFKAKLDEALRSGDGGSVSLAQNSMDMGGGQAPESVPLSGLNFLQNPYLPKAGPKTSPSEAPNFFQRSPSPRNRLTPPDPVSAKPRK
jgi:hypothetical protein